ncbi:hypothetical protein APX70_05428 [Pseudomonas syringae pv. maculicola]|uniref:Uncharacterized protein n=1 Tax=Pseudomonas syringae pv. maculicola TaxID=59511 RepID=A0A3M2ZH25_PSEYM|nr:hypothetical protein APX70_05428 [Pseudomonas syringae pv. maculicola]
MVSAKPGKKKNFFKPFICGEGKPWQPETQSSALRYSRFSHSGLGERCSIDSV